MTLGEAIAEMSEEKKNIVMETMRNLYEPERLQALLQTSVTDLQPNAAADLRV